MEVRTCHQLFDTGVETRTFFDEIVMEVLFVAFSCNVIRCHKRLKLSLPDIAHVAELWCTHGQWAREVVAV